MSQKTYQHFKMRQQMDNDTFEIHHYKDEHLKEVELHEHDFYEIYYFLNGNVIYKIGQNKYHLVSGDILLISPGEKHHPLISRDTDVYERIILRIDPAYLRHLCVPEIDLADCFHTACTTHQHLLRIPASIRRRIENTLFQMLTDIHYSGTNAVLVRTWYLIDILYAMNLMYNFVKDGTVTMRSSEFIIEDVISHINKNYTSSLSLEGLSSDFFISQRHLLREFKQTTGTSVHQYILEKRLSAARNMMADGVPPTEASQQCGFNDYSNFYRAFKKEYHLSPATYFREVKKNREE